MIKYYKALEEKGRPKRIFEIDFLRGILILFMIMDHFFYDFTYFINNFFNFAPGYYGTPLLDNLYRAGMFYRNSDARVIVRIIIIALFLFLSGISCNFSSSNLKRGLLVSLVGIGINFGFLIINKIANTGFYVLFGAISCIGLSILIYGLFKYLYFKIFKNRLCFSIISILTGVGVVLIGFLYFDTYRLTVISNLDFFKALEVIIGRYQFGEDYLPLIPYVGFLFIGGGIGMLIYPTRKSIFNYFYRKMNVKPRKDLHSNFVFFTLNGLYYLYIPFYYLAKGIAKMGKYTIWIYIFHQAVLFLITCIVMYSLGFHFRFN